MAGKAHDTDVVGHVLSAELGPEADLAGFLEQLLLQFHVAEGPSGLVSAGGKGIIIMRAGELDREEVLLGGSPADHERDVVRGAGGGAEAAHLLHEERDERTGILDAGLGLLVEIGLVRAAAAFRDAEEAVFHSFRGLDVDLGGEVALRVDLAVHVERSVLRIAQVLLRISLEHALRDGLLVAEAGPDLLAFFGMDDGGAGVLAERELAFRGDLRIAQEGKGHVFVILRGFRVREYLRHLLVVRTAQQEAHVAEGRIRKERERFGANFQHRGPFEISHGNELLRSGNLVILCSVRSQLEHRSVFEIRHL